MRSYLIVVCLLLISACATRPQKADTVWLSVIGTNDVHGELLGKESGGLEVFSGYVNALRDRRSDDGAILLLDAGDMWQGTLESNLTEGQAMVAAYNALGYDAVAIGNHEFDFGPVGDAAIPESPGDDPRGVLRARALEAQFPLLAANIIDESTGQPVAWQNVSPSVMLERAGVRIGVVGVTTAETLEATIAANTVGLSIAPLAAAIETHAQALRARGAELVFVVAHAGGGCRDFSDPEDLTSCFADAEIFDVARALPFGLVDQIVAGHNHRGIAHVVNGIAITSSYSSARAFGRVDYEFDRGTRRLTQRVIHAPQRLCLFVIPGQADCASASDPEAERVSYEGRSIQFDADVVAITSAAAAHAEALKSAPLGVVLKTDITLDGDSSSALGRLMTDAMREATGADMAIHNVGGGIRANLRAGSLTYGDVYRAFPFDNRISLLRLSVADIRKMLASQASVTGRRAGISGIRAIAECRNGDMRLVLQRSDGSVLKDDEVLTVVANDYLLLGGNGIFSPIMPAEGFALDASQPLVRDVWVNWFRARGGSISAESYLTPEQQRWYLPDPLPQDCRWR